MKMLRSDRSGPRELVPPSRVRHDVLPKPKKSKKSKYKQPYKRKRRKGLMAKIFEEAFDAIEDIFD